MSQNLKIATMLDRKTIVQVTGQLSKRCASEVEVALVDTVELTIGCKQEVQSVLSGLASADVIPDLKVPPILRHQTAISLSAIAIALLILVLRILFRPVTVKKTKKKKHK